MTPLERRYRAALRLLPSAYRRLWVDDMVTALLQGVRVRAVSDHVDMQEAADALALAECRYPPVRELTGVLRLALRLRVGGAHAPARARAWGDGLLRAALVALLVHAVIALTAFVGTLRSVGALPGLHAEAFDSTTGLDAAGVLWIAAYALLALGSLRSCR